MSENQKTIEWAIKEIRELEFMINESIELGSQMNTSYMADIVPRVDEEVVQMVITFNYLKAETKELFMKSKVMTSYQIRDLKSMTTKKDGIDMINLPNPLWTALFSIAFTHTRAILAKSSAGSRFGHMLMPPINPDIEFKKLFARLWGTA